MAVFLSADFLASPQFIPAVTIPRSSHPNTEDRGALMCKHCISHPKCKANQAAEGEKSYLVAISLPKQLSKASQLTAFQ